MAYVPKIRIVGTEKEVIHSAVIHVKNSEPTEIYLDDWSCTVVFKQDDGRTRYQGKIVDGKLILELYNHNDPFGSSIYTPMSIAKVGDIGSIYLTYTASRVDTVEDLRRLELIFWMDKK
ncbi:DUF6864 domain-containing function [Pseudomonas viridiflava]|uniref:DUF6864 domain-containing function n=1 Tax=Pseudomonas viridiflava TaxID=33069 RepID=UPI001C31BE7E|nr:hypothetical protein [Pseudomonas viridiflava]QXG35529.1 hypothetical protein KTT61_26405 [Pseudomonas viridiflava]